MGGCRAQVQSLGGSSSLFTLVFAVLSLSSEQGVRSRILLGSAGGAETGHRDLAAGRMPSGDSGVTPALVLLGKVGLEGRPLPACCPHQKARGVSHVRAGSGQLERRGVGPVSTAARG